MATSLNQDDYLKTALRLPRDLHARIQEAAQQHSRSMNAEIVHRLAISLDRDDIEKEPPLEHRALPPGAVVDHGVEVWAERLLKPENRHELESLLATIRAMLNSAGM
ncbi:Arc family DNA-binding protein [Burkholderia multivorans]|uniref:Arc family DNA-binding protein n=1 Tax=Burkholderia multivorans TaxID=87883 RepID=UPI0021BE6656|nr:Arc family DNA-binding protein [Burkholderia multivorans]